MTQVYEGFTARYSSEPKAMRAGWLSVLGPDPLWPRDVTFTFPGGRYCKSPSKTGEYLALVEEAAPKGDCWAAWSAIRDYDAPGMDRIFADIDSADLEDALTRARRYEDWCMTHFGVQPPAIFTAGKGFHLQFTFDYVEAIGTMFSDAYLSLIQGSGAILDPQPLKHRKASPRIPYSMNLKATGKYRRPMFVVPVDLTWSLSEILKASMDINVMPYQVPHSDVLAGMLVPEVEKAQRALERLQTLPGGIRKGIHEDLVTAAIAFSEEVGWRLVNSQGKPDGRRRLLSSLYAPSLMIQTNGDKEVVTDAIKTWVERAGGQWRDYKGFVESTLKDCVMRDGMLRHPVGLKRFWSEVGDLKVA